MSIITAIWDGDYKYVKDFLETGNDPNFLYGHYEVGGKAQLPLNVAIEHKQFEIAKLLLDGGADPHVEDSYGVNALDVAANQGDTTSVIELLRRGMDVNIKNTNGATPINYSNSGYVLELLLEAGADPNNQKWNGNTPLHDAVADLNIRNVRILLNTGADVFIPNDEGQTPLQMAEGALSARREQYSELREHYPELDVESNLQVIKDIIDLLWVTERRQQL